MLVQRPPRLALTDRLDPDAVRHGAPALVNQRGRAPGAYTPLQHPLGRRWTPILGPPARSLPPLLDCDPAIQLGKTRLRLLHDHATCEVQQLKTRRASVMRSILETISRQIHYKWSRQGLWVITQPLQGRF